MRALLPSTQGASPVALPVLALTISANQDSGYNIATAAGVAVATQIVLTIKPAIRVKVLTTGIFPSGSRLKIINKGVVYAPGGNGGAGANAGGTTGTSGAAGGNAVVITAASLLALIEVDNAAGYILGGGGGGKGGDQANSQPGGGGGGGAGGGTGGAAGTGGAGNATAGAAGKLPAWAGSTWVFIAFAAGGQKGAGGHTSVAAGQDGNVGLEWAGTPAAGDGAAGKAVALNGQSVTFLAGGSAPRVVGVIA